MHAAKFTVSEEAQYRVSSDNGRVWSDLRVIDAEDEADLAVRHGVFLSHRGKLWAFHGAYYKKMEQIHRANHRTPWLATKMQPTEKWTLQYSL